MITKLTKLLGMAFILFALSACVEDFDSALQNVEGRLVTYGTKGFKKLEVRDSVSGNTVVLTDGSYRFNLKKGTFKSDLIEIFRGRETTPIATIELRSARISSDGVVYGDSQNTGQLLSFYGGRKRIYEKDSRTYRPERDHSCTVQQCYQERVYRWIPFDCTPTISKADSAQIARNDQSGTPFTQVTCYDLQSQDEWRSCPGNQQLLHMTSLFHDDYELTFYAGKLDPVASFYQTTKIQTATEVKGQTACIELRPHTDLVIGQKPPRPESKVQKVRTPVKVSEN